MQLWLLKQHLYLLLRTAIPSHLNQMGSVFYREHNGLCRLCRTINIESISKSGGHLGASSYTELKDRKDSIYVTGYVDFWIYQVFKDTRDY